MDDAKLQLLIDRAEISDVQLRYATGLDSRDWPLFRSCFADEIETDFTRSSAASRAKSAPTDGPKRRAARSAASRRRST